ncbi:M14 family zinc carboxypeptidase [Allorhodopirellula heiligendammensis]|uniref:Zinc carboxypeptidase n=1 Tax=Allorhodopirellula heiligendammensis TaxID=2714739 RepID=A0A5C6BFK2_9BACT|nr:M14-type cytosolic carboxypeptidase [Allorhodopirellula heiligendammensis]TWU10086.1 Zinc carboxypeptidase [Allorhodopirellula heiligendammensis]
MNNRTTIVFAIIGAIIQSSLAALDISVQPLRRVKAAEAHQAVAVDESSFYAISNRAVVRYDKQTEECLVRWEAPAHSNIKHLNSGIVVDGRLYCANSDWPTKPLKNTVEIFSAETLKHLESKPFSETQGAINWIDRHRGAWWIVFAFYGDAEVRRTKLVRYDDDWNPTGEWTFPESVVQRFLPNSNSGGAFGKDGRLFVTGHDHAELYVLDVPGDGGELKYISTVPAPISGQGIAWDRDEPGNLLGIVRARHEVVFMKVSSAAEWEVTADFEGASVKNVEIDQQRRSVSFMPGGDPTRGWPCWWYFRIDGLTADEEITLRLHGSDATVGQQKPLGASWAMPARASYSIDGQTWQPTAPGERQGEWMVYRVKPNASSLYVAWGPPYTPQTAEKFMNEIADRSPYATATELCRSRAGRAVPMLHVREGDRESQDRFGVWVQARQHAWESGSSWVAQGFADWIVSDNPNAAWLRQRAEIFIVPIMDVDNVATGNGGKNAIPHDHNRDWSPKPHWNETMAAQRRVADMIAENRMSVFLDLHNPAPGDPTFFYILPAALLQEPMIGLRDRFIDLAYAKISKIKPMIPMSNRPKETGSSYHPLWRQISANWVCMNGNPDTVSLCLETIWNSPNSTTTGYRAVGTNLAAAVKEYLSERPELPQR